ncbi:MAG: lysylphosphatidylglycerol synthase transmembrane domain-containing protein [Planctomycetota bacterium]
MRNGIATANWGRLLKVSLALAGTSYLLVTAYGNWSDQIVLQDGQRLAGNIRILDDKLVFEASSGRIMHEDQIFSGSAQQLHQAGESDAGPVVSYGIRSTWLRSHSVLLTIALAVFVAVPLLQSLRLKIMARSRGIILSYGECARITWTGNFLNFAVPMGSTAGDAYKAIAVSRSSSGVTEAATLVLFDRAIGLGTLLIGVAAVILALPGERLEPFCSYVLILSGLGLSALLLYALPWIRNGRLSGAAKSRCAAIDKIDRTLWGLISDWRTTASAVLITFGIHLAAACAFWMAFLALSMVWHDGAASFYASFSLGELVKALPGPPQGVGTMELAYNWLFAGAGTSAQILSAAIAIRAINLIWSIPGAGVLLTKATAAPQAPSLVVDAPITVPPSVPHA